MDKLLELLAEIESLSKRIYLDCNDAVKLRIALKEAQRIVLDEINKDMPVVVNNDNANPKLLTYLVRCDG